MATDIGPLQSTPGRAIGPLQPNYSVSTNKSFSDTLALTDLDSYIVGIGLALNDTFSFSDVVFLTSPEVDVIVNDSSWVNTLSDTQQYGIGYFMPFVDTFLFLDTVQMNLGLILTGDAVSLSDAIVEVAAIPLALSDDFTFSDAIATYTFGTLVESFSDSISLSDAVSKQLTGLLTLSLGSPDRLVLTDVLAMLLANFYSLADTLALSDSVSIYLSTITNLTETAADTLSLSDGLQLSIGIPISFADTLSLSDSVQVQLYPGVLTVAVGDTLILSDGLSTFVSGTTYKIALTDSLVLGDSIDVLVTESFNSYIRRYLNDVQN